MLDENDALKTELKHNGVELPLVPRIEEVGGQIRGSLNSPPSPPSARAHLYPLLSSIRPATGGMPQIGS